MYRCANDTSRTPVTESAKPAVSTVGRAVLQLLTRETCYQINTNRYSKDGKSCLRLRNLRHPPRRLHTANETVGLQFWFGSLSLLCYSGYLLGVALQPPLATLSPMTRTNTMIATSCMSKARHWAASPVLLRPKLHPAETYQVFEQTQVLGSTKKLQAEKNTATAAHLFSFGSVPSAYTAVCTTSQFARIPKPCRHEAGTSGSSKQLGFRC